MMGYMKNLFISFISFFLLSSLFGQREQPEVRTGFTIFKKYKMFESGIPTVSFKTKRR